MTISPGPPPWPIPPSWTLSPPIPAVPKPEAEPEPPIEDPAPVAEPAPVPEPPHVPDPVPAVAPARTVVVLCPEGSGTPETLKTLRTPPGVTVEARVSPASTPGMGGVYELAFAAAKAVDDGAHGIVIAQEVEAPEETAWALELLHTGEVPLVLAPDPTGPGDVADAVGVAAAELSGFGCLLVARGEIHAARHVRRPGATPVFSSPSAGPAGLVTGGVPRLLWRPPGRLTVRGPHGGKSPQVGLHTITLGDDGVLLRTVAENCDGLVVAANASSIPEPVLPVLAELAGRIPVVLAAPATSSGMLPETGLDPLKARMLMYVLLDSGRDNEAVLEAFAAADRTVAVEV